MNDPNFYEKRVKNYTKSFLDNLRDVDNELDIMAGLSNAPGLLYGMDKLINRKKIESLLEERIRDQIENKNQDPEPYIQEVDDAQEFINDIKPTPIIEPIITPSVVPKPEPRVHINDEEYRLKKIKKKKKQILNEKIQLLTYLDRLKRKGISVKELDVNSGFDEIKFEVTKHRQRRKIEFGKHIFTQILLDIIRIIEFISMRIEIVNLHLDGWHRNVRYHLDEYDDVIEEIVEKYSQSSDGDEGISISPEAKLGLLLLVSAIDHSASNSGVSSGIGSVKSLFGGETKVETPTDDLDADILKEIEEEKLKFN